MKVESPYGIRGDRYVEGGADDNDWVVNSYDVGTERGRRRFYHGVVVFFVLAVLIQGCSYRAWYDGFRSGERHRCEQYQSPEYEACLAQSDVDYETYKKEREGGVTVE